MSYGPVHQGNVSKCFAAKGVYAPKITCFHLAGILGLYLVVNGRAGTNTPSDEYDTYRDTGWRIRYVSRIHFFSEAKLGNG